MLHKSKSLGTRVLGYLRALCPDLPKKGIIAGGSVANTAATMMGVIRNTIINDIDLYIIGNVKKGRNSERYPSTMGYRISRTEQKGLLNIIYVDILNNEKSIMENIIGTFDINAVQAGIDLASGMLYYTSYFNYFLETGTLKIVDLHSPMYSVLRCIKKSNELGVTFYLEEALDELNYLVEECHENFGIEVINEKYEKIYDANHLSLSKYFALDYMDCIDDTRLVILRWVNSAPADYDLSDDENMPF